MRRRLGLAGFTIVELLTALAISLILLGLAYQTFIIQRRTYSSQEQVAEMQQNARTASDALSRALRNVGNGVDENQPQLIYCGPYEILFNSDLDNDLSTGPLSPNSAIHSIADSSSTIYTSPSSPFSGGAESHLLALRKNGSRHYDLVKKTLWASGESEAEIALDLNIHDASGNEIPLFLYWGDFGDGANPDLWGDSNGDGELDATETAALTPLTDATLSAHLATLGLAARKLDDSIQRIDVQITAETENSDKSYANNDGYRQTLLKSTVAPRNLHSCPTITSSSESVKLTTTEINAGQGKDYAFTVSYKNAPDPNRDVIVSLTRASSDSETVLSTPSALTTDSNGQIAASIDWGGCETFEDVINSGDVKYTLTATVQSVQTNQGTCQALSKNINITVGSGDADRIELSTGSSLSLKTCEDPEFQFTAKAKDVCGLEVEFPPTEPTFQVTDNNNAGASFGRFQVSSSQASYSSRIYTVAESGSGAYAAVQDSHGNFSLRVEAASAPAWMTGGMTWPSAGDFIDFSVKPWPPQMLGSITSNIALTLPHRDCPSAGATDTFMALDCKGNPIHTLGNGYSIDVSIDNARFSPSDQGSVSQTDSINGIDGGNLFDVTYTPPSCTIGPSRAIIKPEFTISLDGTSSKLGPFDISLQSCVACSLAVASAKMTECSGSSTFKVSGCNLNGETVELEVASTGGNGSFNPSTVETTTTLTFPASGDATVSSDIYIGDAKNGDTLTVIAYYPSKAKARWSCGAATIDVVNKCESIKTYTDSRYSKILGAGGASCLSRVDKLYFEVEDCQFAHAALPDAVVVYAISDSGNYLDKETVDIQEYSNSAANPSTFRSTAALPVGESIAATQLDGKLTYPPNQNVQIFAAYSDPNDPSGDNHDPALTVPAAAPSAGICQQSETLTRPLPVCLSNAAASANGAPGAGSNYRLNGPDANEDLCISCCSLAVSPANLTIAQSSSKTLSATGGAGSISWSSVNPGVASVNSLGEVSGTSTGSAYVKAVDENNCAAYAAVEVVDQCGRFKVDPARATIHVGGMQLFKVASPPSGSSISWSSSDPNTVSIDAATGVATGEQAGTTVISASDSLGQCGDVQAFITVSGDAAASGDDGGSDPMATGI